MKVIIAGSRSIARISSRRWDYDEIATILENAVEESGFQISEVISGGAGGPDRAGEQWAACHAVPFTTIKPNWKLGRGAGLIANRELAEAGEALIALHDGERIDRRLPEIERLIRDQPENAFAYATGISQQFLDGEEAIKTDPELWWRYTDKFLRSTPRPRQLSHPSPRVLPPQTYKIAWR